MYPATGFFPWTLSPTSLVKSARFFHSRSLSLSNMVVRRPALQRKPSQETTRTVLGSRNADYLGTLRTLVGELRWGVCPPGTGQTGGRTRHETRMVLHQPRTIRCTLIRRMIGFRRSTGTRAHEDGDSGLQLSIGHVVIVFPYVPSPSVTLKRRELANPRPR